MKLKCHCGRWLATWTPPAGGDGGELTVACARCGPTCAECQGLPSFTLHTPLRFLYPRALLRLWEALVPRAS